MQRIRELIASTKTKYPSDEFFSSIETTWKTSRQARAQYAGYERALRVLDPESWAALKAKAVAHFSDHRKGQLKQGFFNQLNEAFAYEHLVRSGCQCVRILKETGKTIPDISYNFQGTPGHCEVKTIGISEEEIARWEKIEAFSGAIYHQLSDGFLGKLDSTLTSADSQISAKGTAGLIYVVVLFDDFTLMYYKTYRKQIVSKIRQHKSPNIRVKIGLQGQRRISKGSSYNLF